MMYEIFRFRGPVSRPWDQRRLIAERDPATGAVKFTICGRFFSVSMTLSDRCVQQLKRLLRDQCPPSPL